MKASALVFSLAVFIGIGAAARGFAQATARSTGKFNTVLTTNNNLFVTATGDAAAYSKAGDQVAGFPDTEARYNKPNPLPNPPPPALAKVNYTINVKSLPLKGDYAGIGVKDVNKFPNQVPKGVAFKVMNEAFKEDPFDATKFTKSYADAQVDAERGEGMAGNKAELLASGTVDQKSRNVPGIAVARASDPWIITSDADIALTFEASLDVDLAALAPSADNGAGVAQIEACGAFYCLDCDDPNPVTWDYAWWVGPGDSYNATVPLVPAQTVYLQATRTYELDAILVSAAATLPDTK